MKSIAFIQSLVTSLLPAHQLKHVQVNLFGWNRTKDGRSEAEFTKMLPKPKKRFSRYGGDGWCDSATNSQAYGSFKADCLNWEKVVRDHHKVGVQFDRDSEWGYSDEQVASMLKEEVGIGAKLDMFNTHEPLYIPMIDFEPGLMMTNRHTKLFWEELQKYADDCRLYLFNSGNSHHGVLNRLMDSQTYCDWLQFLSEHEEVVDQSWVEFARAYYSEHAGVIRITEGKTRPCPTLLKWVNL